ncbi:MBL fold metallo-hydrolase [Streptomyces wedmorensis]|uniref:Beta-lactamase n=1 Tax=Streptomyces viridochromogenes TaxID=1938 RepID=A0A0L8KI99_STRVR|nr:beta-lactamase [Streptomyces viridochromogenes]
MAERRSVLKGVLAASGVALAGVGTSAAAPLPGRRGPYSTPVELRWLGVSGWEIVIDGDRSIVFDPYLSRMPCLGPTGALDPGLPLRTDRAAVERVAERHLAGAPELILVSHGHFDHVADVPQLLGRPEWRRNRIRTVCDETVRHLLTAMGTPSERVADVIQVRGGEYLQFDGYTVEVFRSLHSQLADHGSFAPGRRAAPPRRPVTLGDLVEGETLAFQVSVDSGPRILLMGASNFVERELAGIRPDVALVPMTSHGAVHRYVERLLSATGNPPLLIPTHHDDLTAPLGAGLAAGDTGPSAAERLSRLAPGDCRVLDPGPLRPVDLRTAFA